MFFKATCCWSNATTIQSTHKYYKISYSPYTIEIKILLSTTALNDLVLKYFIYLFNID